MVKISSFRKSNRVCRKQNRCDNELAKSLGGEGFDDMINGDIQELLIKEADEADLVGVNSFELNQMNSENDSTDKNPKLQNFTLKCTQESINLVEQLEFYFLKTDLSTKRSAKFKREFQKV